MKTEFPARTKTIQIVAFTSLLALLLIVKLISGSPTQTNERVIHVVKANDSTAIPQTHVSIRANAKVIFQTDSDTSGIVRLPLLVTQNLTIRFDAPGFISEELVGQSIGTVPQTIRLFKEAVLRGKVSRKKDGSPISGAHLNLWGVEGHVQTLTDQQGVYYFSQLRSGFHTLQLQVPGYGIPESEQVEISGGQNVERNFALASASLVTGKVFDKETNKPLKNIYVALTGNSYYNDYTDDSGFFSFASVQPGTYELRAYHEGFKELAASTLQVTEGKSILNQVYLLEALPPQFEIYTYQQVFLPGEKIQTKIRSYRIHELNCKLFRISAAELREKRGTWIRPPIADLEKRTPVTTWTKKIDIQDISRWQLRTISVPVPRKGFYLLFLSTKNQKKIVPFISSELALIVKAAPDKSILWSHSLRNSAPVAGTDILVEQNEWKADGTQPAAVAGRTNRDGLLTVAAQNSASRIWAFHGEDIAYVDAYAGNDSSNQIKGYIYTDRPVYRPGHTVHFKGILRKELGDAYQVLSGLSTRVFIRDSSGTVVEQQQITTSAHGSFSGDFKLADEPALGTYRIELQTNGTPSGQFKVLEYRKPEFSIQVLPEKERYFNNDTIHANIIAKYYFGSPVSNQKVEYTVYDSPYYSWNSYAEDDSDFEEADYDDSGWEGDYYGYGGVITSGSVDLDANGQAFISFSAAKQEFDRYYNIEAKIVDASRREVTGRGRVLVVRGEYKLGIFTDSCVYSTGEKMQFRIRSTDYDDHPLSIKAEVTGSYQHWDEAKKSYAFMRSWSQPIQTDKNGTATFTIAATKSGYARVDIIAQDSRNNQITSTSWVWITGESDDFYYWGNQRAIQLVADQKKKQPGDLTKVLINSSPQDVYALVTFEGKLLHKAEVIQLKQSTKLLSFSALKEYAPTLWVSVTFTSKKQFYTRAIPIQISPSSQFLKIDVTSDKAQYKPRETAKYQIKVIDASGHPVATEFSFSLVDESIYAVSPEIVPDIQKFFYGPTPNRVVTYYSFPPRYLGGADKDGNKQIRKDFPDTAFWTAAAQTNANGLASLEVRLPDSLTTWRATVRAASDDTRVGSTIQKIIATKPFIARLETPRFFTVGDSITISGVFHNLSSRALTVRTDLLADGKLRAENPNNHQLVLNPNDIKRVDWRVQVITAGTTRLILKADAASDFDGMQLDIPVYPFGLQKLKAFAGQTATSVDSNFEINSDENFPSSTLQLYLTPSVAGMAFDSLEYLTGYPYGCVEQTMSRFLPDIVVEQALKKLNLPAQKLSSELPKQINAGLQRLYHFQHDDGGWGWWENDESNPYMTAYVIYGLSQAEKSGYVLDPDRFQRGIEALKNSYAQQKTFRATAYMLYALAESGKDPQFVSAKLQEAQSTLDQFDPYSLSVITLSALDNNDQALATKSLQLLKAKASVSETNAFWLPPADSYGWCDNKIETTAYALRALLRIEPDSPFIPKIVRWLSAQRQGNHWESTKDTAATVISLMEYLQRSHELEGHYTARIVLNNKPAGEFQVTGENLWNLRKELDFHAQDLKKGKNDLRLEISGTGTLYYSAELRYFEDGKKVTAENRGIDVRREYFRYKRTADLQTHALQEQTEELRGDIKVGEEIMVKLTVHTSQNLEYVIVEDPLPSGFEVVTNPGDYYEWTYWYCGRQIRDEKIAFFSTWLYDGTQEIYYIIRAESPASLRVSPPQSWAMYLPEIRGNGIGAALTVKD